MFKLFLTITTLITVISFLITFWYIKEFPRSDKRPKKIKLNESN